MNAIEFFAMLERTRVNNPAAVAKLRRSLADDPGNDPDVYPIVEPWVSTAYPWTRQMAYLVAGLWAAHAPKARPNTAATIAEAFRHVPSSSGESRFIALLDADPEELPWRLRQAVALVSKSAVLDWPRLLDDVIRWNLPARTVQHRWAKDYYKKRPEANESNETTKEEQ